MDIIWEGLQNKKKTTNKTMLCPPTTFQGVPSLNSWPYEWLLCHGKGSPAGCVRQGASSQQEPALAPAHPSERHGVHRCVELGASGRYENVHPNGQWWVFGPSRPVDSALVAFFGKEFPCKSTSQNRMLFFPMTTGHLRGVDPKVNWKSSCMGGTLPFVLLNRRDQYKPSIGRQP